MDKHVIVIASGETERIALPYLTLHLRDMGISVSDVRIPPSNRALDVVMAERLIKSAWFENAVAPPDKFVVLVDTDGAASSDALSLFKSDLPGRLGAEIRASIQYAYAQQHLEAWYFADAANLRSYLGGRALGNVDTSKPDEIENPKRHLKNVLGGRFYTARISGEIATTLDARTIAQRSPSFRGFMDAVMNGSSTGDTDGT